MFSAPAPPTEPSFEDLQTQPQILKNSQLKVCRGDSQGRVRSYLNVWSRCFKDAKLKVGFFSAKMAAREKPGFSFRECCPAESLLLEQPGRAEAETEGPLSHLRLNQVLSHRSVSQPTNQQSEGIQNYVPEEK